MNEVIQPGDRASMLGRNICYNSHDNNPAVLVVPHQPNNFRGAVGFLWQPHILEQMLEAKIDPQTKKILKWTMLEQVENDGAGGKPQFFSLVGTPAVFHGLGWEIITMCADDFARSGRFPAVFLNAMDVKQITEKNFPSVNALFDGFGEALAQAHLVNITGEVAVMKHSITAFCDIDSPAQLVLTWGGACIGLAHHDLLIDNSRIESGMPIVGFREAGYRCNGGTFFTELLLKKYGSPEMIMINDSAREFAEKLTVPSRSYARTVCRIVGWNDDGSVGTPLAGIAGIAHITGGGVWGKFKEILPKGVGAQLDGMPDPPKVLLEAQQLSLETDSPLSDWQAYSTFHGGCGMLMVAATLDDAHAIIQEAEKDGIEALVVGITIPQENNEVQIYSRFSEYDKFLSSEHPE